MPSAEKQVRVFISSTFRDMHAERDHLVTVVFPELRERVEHLGLEFFDVDLRWGVPTKDANGETANSWEYCRQWIDRVEPFFVCILGQRYGWVPEPEQLKAQEDRHRQQDERRSITDMEVRHAVLNTKLKRRSYFYLRATNAPPTASEYVDSPPLLRKLEQLKNEVRTCGRPVRDYPCDWTGSGFAGMEEFGRRVLADLWSGVLRDDRYVSKGVWRQVLDADPDADPRYRDEAVPVPEDIAAKIVKLAKPAPKEPLDAEREQMDMFAASRLRWFQGRTVEIQQLTDFLNSTAADAPHLAVVAAVPGQGKSALLAHLHEQLKSLPNFIITHFVGATEGSASAHALVERLLGELDRSGIKWPTEQQEEGQEAKRDFNSLCLRLALRLGDYAGERRIVILLDALNQLSDGHDLQWLPHRIGSSVRVIVSCVEDAAAKTHGPEQRVLQALTSRQPVPLRVPLGPLTEADVRTIVVTYLKEYCHELDREHLDTLCAISQARNPLYLLVMLNELRTLGGNDLNTIIPARIASMPQDHADTVSLFRWVLQRLEVFGPEAVRWWCLYLAHGRVGMASHELADLLARKLGADAAATALRIERGLRRYLQRRGPQLDFFHGQLRQAVLEQYDSQAEATTVHHEMANYFTDCAKGTDAQKEWETNSVRGFAECVFHLTKAGHHERAASLLTKFSFLVHKLRAGLLESAFEDYGLLRREAPTEVTKQLEIWADFFHEKAHILRRGNEEWPAHKLLLQLAMEHADDSPLTIGAEQWLANNLCDWLWLRRVLRLQHVQKNSCLEVFEGHTSLILGVIELANGRLLSWSQDTTLRIWDVQSGSCAAVLNGHNGKVNGALALTNGHILSWADCELRLWDSNSMACLALLEGHTEAVTIALELDDGRLLSCSFDNTLRLWNGNNGACLGVLTGHTGICGVGVPGFVAALELADGRLLSWSSDTTLRIWDGHGGACLAVLGGHSDDIYGAMETADGQLLSWSGDNTLRLWDGHSGACLAVLEGHTDRIIGAHNLANGRLLSCSFDNTLRLWDNHNGSCLNVLEGHTSAVIGALPLADGRLVSWSTDGSLRVWDCCSGQCIIVLSGHTQAVEGALNLADGRLVSWSSDKTLRVWDNQNGKCLAIFSGHTHEVRGVIKLSGDRLLSWAWERLRLWDSNNTALLVALDGHSDWVRDAFALADGRLLSWSQDHTLRLWDSLNGKCLMILKGHTWSVSGALVLVNGQILSWSEDHTLRVWDSQNGNCLIVLVGHTRPVYGVLALADGRLLSWSADNTLRLWNSNSGACLAVLEGHTGSFCAAVWGALVLADGRLLSWSDDETLRVWNSRDGACLMVLEGHRGRVIGALELADGRLLSWALGAFLYEDEPEDLTEYALRVWDSHSGECLAVLEGHTFHVAGAMEMADGRLLSWSEDETFRLWDSRNGNCIMIAEEDCVAQRYPDLLYARMKARNSGSFAGDFFTDSSARAAHLHRKTILSILAAWNADANSAARYLLPDGTIVVTQGNGQVCVLKLFHGNRRVSLAEVEEILTKQMKNEGV